MYKPIASGGLLAMTGVGGYFLSWGWYAVGAVVIGGALVTINKFGPRLAIEPIRQESGKYRFNLTKNGQTWRPFKRRR
jgi:hypothetical protein